MLEECYGNQIPSYTICKDLYRRFNRDDFDVNEKSRSEQSNKYNDNELEINIQIKR